MSADCGTVRAAENDNIKSIRSDNVTAWELRRHEGHAGVLAFFIEDIETGSAPACGARAGNFLCAEKPKYGVSAQRCTHGCLRLLMDASGWWRLAETN